MSTTSSINYHAVLTDECGGEFGASVFAADRDAAYEELAERYPESTVVQLESPQDTQKREQAIYARVSDDDWLEDDYD